MPRGGARPGAGRPKKPLPREVEAIRSFDLISRLRRMPAGPVGRQRRAVLTMSAYDVPRAEIAVALAVRERDLAEFFGEELATGDALRFCNTTVATWALARAGKWSAISWLLRRMERAERQDRERNRE